MILRCFIAAFFILLLSACGLKNVEDQQPTGPTTAEEVAFCATSTNYPSGVVVNGTARFYKRDLRIVNGGSAQIELKGSTTTPQAIKYAEVRVVNEAGTIVQCGKTNSSGALKALNGSSDLTIPNTAGQYTVLVSPRANHIMTVPGGKPSFVFYISVKSDYYSNNIYSESITINSTGSGPITANITAYALESQSSSVLGGAFNIYNSILAAYEFLATNTANSDLSCLNPKLDVFWKAGFNPAQYLYPSENPGTLSGASFYLRGRNQLFIMGGRLGNVSTEDTDQFDDPIILHEFGHRLEDACGKSDSPGQTHYGLYREDPRLAWSEGFANFFGAHIVKNKLADIQPDVTAGELPVTSGWVYYYDTRGYDDAGTLNNMFYFALNFTKAGNNPENAACYQYIDHDSNPATPQICNIYYSYDKVDPSTNPGESHFREISIARGLFKGTNTCLTLCSNTNYFEYYWRAFENNPAGIGMGKSNYAFRSSALFYDRLDAAFSGSTPSEINDILNTDEALQRKENSSFVTGGRLNWPAYGIRLVNNGSTPCTNPLRIQPKSNLDYVTDTNSDQRFSNHFYRVDMSQLSGVTSITISADKTAGTTVDLDLILFNDGYKFNEDCSAYNTDDDCTAYAKQGSSSAALTNRTAALSTSINKSLTGLATLNASQKYLLNVRAFLNPLSGISNTTEYNYSLLTQTGDYLCPSTTY